MRLILADIFNEIRGNFYPLALGRPIWELWCGFNSLGERLIEKVGASDVACFVPDYMADSYRAKTKYPVNDLSTLKGDDLLILNPCIKAQSFNIALRGPSEVGLDKQGNMLYARIAKDDLSGMSTDEVGKFIDQAKAKLPNTESQLPR